LLRAKRQLGFAIGEQAHHDGMPNRVYLRYGLIVHLRLLSTPPRGDAVTFSCGMPEHPGKDFHLADSMQSPAHSPARGEYWIPALCLSGATALRDSPSDHGHCLAHQDNLNLKFWRMAG
jgi:hypothetical protein